MLYAALFCSAVAQGDDRSLPSEHGPMAWDVDRLVALTKDLPRVQVPLSTIRELDEPYWFGQGDVPVCRSVVDHARLIAVADLSYPIILSPNGRVMDGMHRVGKAMMLGHLTVEAVRLVTDVEPDYIGVDPDELPYDEGVKVNHSIPRVDQENQALMDLVQPWREEDAADPQELGLCIAQPNA